jgi:glucosyl-dolichyl phosphate glucuronosyltransferase
MISVVVCTYNRCEVLKRTLKSLAEMELPPDFSWELLVVDNNSTDATREYVGSLSKECRIPLRYLFESQQGMSFALNAGIKGAKGEIVAFTDDDVRVDPHWLTRIAEAFEKFDCAGVGGKIIPEWTFQKPSWLIEEGPYRLIDVPGGYNPGNEPCEITMKTRPFAANFALRRWVFDKYGLFRTDLGPVRGKRMPGNESELCRRMLEAGEKLFYVPQAVIHHLVDRKKITKSHYKHTYFAFGRSFVRRWGVPGDAVYYFGFPRMMLPGLVLHTMKWFSATDRRHRFYHKMQAYQRAGEIYEARQMFIQANRQKSASHSGTAAHTS